MSSNQLDMVRSEMARLRMQVSNLLGWTDLEYASFQEAMGLLFLRSSFGGSGLAGELGDELAKHKEFWSWWRIHWMRRDREFLELSGSLFPSEYANYYRELHDATTVVFKPHGDVLMHTYRLLLAGIMDKEVCHE